ncbi:MAG: hypothetical protein AABM66_02990 [Actinomycetota bacterium]
MSKLKQPLRLWHGLLAVVAALAIGVAGTAIAGGGNGGSHKDLTTAGFGGQGGFVKSGKHRYGVKTRGVPPGDSQTGTRLKCPRKTRVIAGGGGGFSNAPNEQSINYNGPFDSGDRGAKPDNGWQIFVNNEGVDGTEGMAVWTICVKKR